MIVYNKLWETMKAKNINQYQLIKDYHISTSQLDRLRKNAIVKTSTLDTLCSILSCRIEEIAEYIESPSSI
jgi:DNA-binding Xre family transcriptional regulator